MRIHFLRCTSIFLMSVFVVFAQQNAPPAGATETALVTYFELGMTFALEHGLSKVSEEAGSSKSREPITPDNLRTPFDAQALMAHRLGLKPWIRDLGPARHKGNPWPPCTALATEMRRVQIEVNQFEDYECSMEISLLNLSRKQRLAFTIGLQLAFALLVVEKNDDNSIQNVNGHFESTYARYQAPFLAADLVEIGLEEESVRALLPVRESDSGVLKMQNLGILIGSARKQLSGW